MPLALVHAYLGVCRALDRPWEAAAAILTGGALGVVGTAIGASVDGLVGVATAWVTAQSLTAIWSVWRLRSLSGQLAPA